MPAVLVVQLGYSSFHGTPAYVQHGTTMRNNSKSVSVRSPVITTVS